MLTSIETEIELGKRNHLFTVYVDADVAYEEETGYSVEWCGLSFYRNGKQLSGKRADIVNSAFQNRYAELVDDLLIQESEV